MFPFHGTNDLYLTKNSFQDRDVEQWQGGCGGGPQEKGEKTAREKASSLRDWREWRGLFEEGMGGVDWASGLGNQ